MVEFFRVIVSFERITGDALSNCNMAIDCWIDTQHNIIEGNHCDVYQLFGSSTNLLKKNYIAFGIRASNLVGVQAFLLDKTNSIFENIAIVDIAVETPSGESEKSQINSSCTHVFISNVSMPNQGLVLRDDFTGTSEFVPVDTVVQNLVAWRLWRGSIYSEGVTEGMLFRNCLLRDTPMISNGDVGVSNLSTGQVEINFYPDYSDVFPGGTWLNTGPASDELIGTGIVLPGWLDLPPNKGFVPSN